MSSFIHQLVTLSILVLLALCPHQSIQQTTVQATCTYSYNYQNIYECYLVATAPVTSTDVLEITGTHLENHTDDDVEAVLQLVKFNTTFNGHVLQKFVNLKNLDISGRNLLDVNSNAFEVCPKLERLFLRNGQLTSLPPRMLKNCENLVYFECWSQSLDTFPEDLFGNTRNLEEFEASSNKLTSLPEKLLQNMQKLRKLRIGYNKLTNLNSNFLINNPNLEEVTLFNNEFQYQDDITYALNGHPNLKELWINDNKFTNFDFRFFSQFQKLETLIISLESNSKLTGISWHSLPASLTELRVYTIGEEIPENAFERLVRLTSLSMSGTGFENLHKEMFKPLTSLVSLFIAESSLKVLHPDLFKNQINLSHLVIRNSQIQELPPGIFAPLVNIGIVNKYNGIDVTSSKLRRLNANSFGQHPHLQSISFYDNEINEIERGIFSKFHPNISFAGFDRNKCVSKNLSGENLDNSTELEQCFNNWEDAELNSFNNK